MKLQNLSVIFIIIAIPLILITSYYISLQIDTINMQTAYNTKLLDSTKEAIDAFEINTVEWNAAYAGTADSKRRDVMASINAFTRSFANNIGVGGTSKEYILAYMPAIAYTLYDGYYIYSPAETKQVFTDDNGVGVMMSEKLADEDDIIEDYTYNSNDEGKLLYVPNDGASSDGKYNGTPFTLNPLKAADSEYKHILKPFATYSERIDDGDNSIVINYTLDNYVTIYGIIEDTDGDDNLDYVLKSGYLTQDGKIEIPANNGERLRGITYNGKEMLPENLEEQVAWNNGTETSVNTFGYVYEADQNTKVYYEGTGENAKFFRLNKDLNKVYVDDLSTPVYKKCTVPKKIRN